MMLVVDSLGWSEIDKGSSARMAGLESAAQVNEWNSTTEYKQYH